MQQNEEENTQFLRTPKTKTSTISKEKHPKSVKWFLQRNNSKKNATMTIEGEGVDKDEEPCGVEVLCPTK